jgi:hypothetical protein
MSEVPARRDSSGEVQIGRPQSAAYQSSSAFTLSQSPKADQPGRPTLKAEVESRMAAVLPKRLAEVRVAAARLASWPENKIA